ncbi:MAG: hypothetical protein GWP05_01825 [Anaerolineaceae bacterium]|nr:hypothetical protein [Anaerolineaceae bacterium]
MKPEQRTDSRPAPWEPIPEFSPPDPQIEARLGELWRTIDRRLDRVSSTCRACGQCCDFPRRHHVLFATKCEMDVCLSWAMKNLSLTQDDMRRRLACGRCPFQQDRLCAVHPVRPLGCRHFFCTPGHRRRLDRVSGVAQRRIRQIIKGANNLGWYGPALSYLMRNTHYL